MHCQNWYPAERGRNPDLSSGPLNTSPLRADMRTDACLSNSRLSTASLEVGVFTPFGPHLPPIPL
jgi:hypothetical protein